MPQLKGRTIQWNADKSAFEILNYNPCPVLMGEPIPFMGEGVEWLADYIPVPPISYDQRVYVRIDKQQPSDTPHPEWPMYKTWITTYDKEKRPLADIIKSIEAEEANANAALLKEAEESKLSFFMSAYTLAIAKGVTPTDEEANAEKRHADVVYKMAQNAARRVYLIEQFTAGNVLDISEGFERDNIAIGNTPFVK